MIVSFRLQSALLMQLHSRGLVEWWSSEKRWYSVALREYVDRKFREPSA